MNAGDLASVLTHRPAKHDGIKDVPPREFTIVETTTDDRTMTLLGRDVGGWERRFSFPTTTDISEGPGTWVIDIGKYGILTVTQNLGL